VTNTPGPILLETSSADVSLSPVTPESCDRCGPAVRALWQVSAGTGVLTFCGSCYRRFRKIAASRE